MKTRLEYINKMQKGSSLKKDAIKQLREDVIRMTHNRAEGEAFLEQRGKEALQKVPKEFKKDDSQFLHGQSFTSWNGTLLRQYKELHNKGPARTPEENDKYEFLKTSDTIQCAKALEWYALGATAWGENGTSPFTLYAMILENKSKAYGLNSTEKVQLDQYVENLHKLGHIELMSRDHLDDEEFIKSLVTVPKSTFSTPITLATPKAPVQASSPTSAPLGTPLATPAFMKGIVVTPEMSYKEVFKKSAALKNFGTKSSATLKKEAIRELGNVSKSFAKELTKKQKELSAGISEKYGKIPNDEFLETRHHILKNFIKNKTTTKGNEEEFKLLQDYLGVKKDLVKLADKANPFIILSERIASSMSLSVEIREPLSPRQQEAYDLHSKFLRFYGKVLDKFEHGVTVFSQTDLDTIRQNILTKPVLPGPVPLAVPSGAIDPAVAAQSPSVQSQPDIATTSSLTQGSIPIQNLEVDDFDDEDTGPFPALPAADQVPTSLSPAPSVAVDAQSPSVPPQSPSAETFNLSDLEV